MPLHLAASLVLCLLPGCGDNAPAEPLQRVAATVVVSPSSVALSALGDTIRFTATVLDQNGEVMEGSGVTYASSDEAVAAVDDSGLVMAVTNGTVAITAMAGLVSGSGTVTVAQAVSAVGVSPDTAAVVAGDTLRFTAMGTDANGHVVSEAEFAWSSSDTLVAVVDDSGLATGVGAGSATITAISSTVKGLAEFVTLAPTPTTVTMAPEMVEFTALGQTMALSAEVYDQLGRVMEGTRVTWSSGDTMVALVDSVGLVEAVGRGETRVVAMADGISAEATITVRQSVASVAIVPYADTIAPGDTLRLTARAYDVNGHVFDDAEFTWSSRDTSVAQVDSRGLVLGLDEGVAGIVASASDAAGTALISVVSPDRAVLLALYEAMGGTRWTSRANWATDAPLRTWSGVGLNDRGRIGQLNLSRNNLSGSIPPEIGALTELERLMLGSNNLNGSIPPEIKALTKLVWLYAESNNLSGSIPPEIGALTELEHLYLAGNNLNGSIPPEIGRLTKLELLHLSDNNLHGRIPPEIGKMARLEALHLSYNQLSGSVPPEVGGLTRLRGLYLSHNEVSGSIPPELGQLLHLESLDLRRNNLTGRIPPQLGRLANLRSLRIVGTTFFIGGPGTGGITGPIPPELGQLTNLKRLELGRNRLTGPIPPELGRLSVLEELRLSNNSLTGPIPPELGELTNLRTLSLTGNRLTAIPGELGRLANLESLYMQFSAVTGIPPELGNLAKLKRLWLGFSRLSGRIPPELGNLANLEELDLGVASLTGSIPPELGNLTNLERLQLNDNRLEGSVPPELGGLARLEELHLFDNRLTSIPLGIGGMERLLSLDLAGNLLTTDGLPPGVFSDLPSLERLDLSRNQLKHLPAGLFLGLPRLSELRLGQNPGAPFTLAVEARRVDSDDLLAPGPAEVAVYLAAGAPLDLRIPLSVHGGSISADAAVLETGRDRSTEVTVTQGAGGRSGTEVVVGPLPALPHRLSGVQLEAAGSLVLFGDITNRAPSTSSNLPWIRMREGDEPRGIHLSSYFEDPDGDGLEYSAVSSNPGVVSVSLADDRLTLTSLSPGSTTITVTATDPGRLAAESSLTVSVRGERRGSYAIDLIMVDSPGEDVEAVFDDAVEYWESILADTELPDIRIGSAVPIGCRGITTEQSLETVDDLAIVASVGEVDGRGNVLGWAALCGIREESRLPLIGVLRFDAADLEVLRESDAMEEVIIHEIGHLLGIGTVWHEQGLLIKPSLADGRGADTHFRGPLAIAAFNDAGGGIYTGGGKVPVENFARPGSADSHWRESVLDHELMTPSLSLGVPNPLSAITIQSLADMGYTVDVSLAEPFRLPGTADRAPGEDVRKIEYRDDVRHGPILVFGLDGRVVTIIRN